ncbi:MAG: RHS repeat protein [Chitinophagaceae bacterium]|nr:RHS repeat protein [Chitinophagaceae bacterium]
MEICISLLKICNCRFLAVCLSAVKQKKQVLLFLIVFFVFGQPEMNAQFTKEKVVLSRLAGIDTDDPETELLEVNAITHVQLPSSTWAAARIRNVVLLKIKEESSVFIPNDFTATLAVEIKYGDDELSAVAISRNLAVNYKKAAGEKYQAQQAFSFEGAAFVSVKVTGITITGVDEAIGTSVLELEDQMFYTLAYVLNAAGVPSSFSHSNTIGDELSVHVSWAESVGNNGYQLEWAWVEDDVEDTYKEGGVVIPSKIFIHNATRVDLSVDQFDYPIPLYYDGTGKLYYRVRPILVSDAGVQAGNWSYCSSPFTFEGHEKKLNWQVNTSFAEEGKRKSVMQYYDGTLRNRQTATKDNTTNTVVLAESLYDEQGRPAVQILPTPTIQSVIAYTRDLNLFNGQTPGTDPLKFFDLAPATAEVFPAPMVKTSGAANYYSDQNERLTSTSIEKELPDAEGYTYTLTRYTPDATGRVAMQSGVGKAFRMGGGKETRYYYGTPSQEELDGLFGTEVGEASHYFKNMVRDANGQMSVSYVDMHGRTIATALAGASPASLVSLNNSDPAAYIDQAGSFIKRDLLRSGSNNIFKGNTIESITSLLVPVAEDYSFKYHLDTASIQLPTCTSGVRCYDLLFDLDFSFVYDSPDSLPKVYQFTNVPLLADDDCVTPALFLKDKNGVIQTGNNIQIDLRLQPGSYTVRKSLRLSEKSLEHYKELYLQKALCKTEQEIIDSIYSVLITTTDCNEPVVETDCAACLSSVGDSATFRSNYLVNIDWEAVADTTALNTEIRLAYQDAINKCNSLCLQVSNLLKSKRELMLQDMIPFTGQYATRRIPVSGDTLTLYNKYNIFSTTTPATQPFYRHPKNTDGSADGYYKDAEGAIDLTIHPNGATQPYDLLNTLDKDEFTQLFSRSWANSLLPYHPEFPKLRFAELKLQQSYDWIYRFGNIETWQQASDSGFIFTTLSSITDPFYLKAPSVMKSQMYDWITDDYVDTVSMWQVAYGDVKCKDISDDILRASCYTGISTVPPYGTLTTTERDEVWVAFRMQYMAARDRQITKMLADSVPLTDATNLINSGFKLRFPASREQEAAQYGWTGYPDGPTSTLDTTGLTILAGGNISPCSSYIVNWQQSLLQCDSIASHPNRDSILAQITRGMLAVCEKGRDAQNPNGASNVAPGTPVDGSPRTFEEVILNVFQSYGIRINTYCNPYLIQYPKPYNKGPKFGPTVITSIDTCTCTRFGELKAEASHAGYNVTTLTGLNNYLRIAYRDTLSLSLYNSLGKCDSLGGYTLNCYTVYDTLYYHCDSLPPSCENSSSYLRAITPGACPEGYYWNSSMQQCMPVMGPSDTCYVPCPRTVCDTVWRGYSISITPAILPNFLNCNYVATDQCFTCEELSALTKAFKDTFNIALDGGPYLPYNAGPVFYSSFLTDQQVEHNKLYARFLNYRTGLQLSWGDYARLADSAHCNLAEYLGNLGGGVANLDVSTRSGNTPAEYTASVSVQLLPGFESGVNDQFLAYISESGGGPATQTVVCIDVNPPYDTTGVVTVVPPCERVSNMSITQGQEIYRIRKQYLLGQFETAYRQAFEESRFAETFTVGYTSREYHYTLYYYDQAGNLVKTVPPKGVNPDFSDEWLEEVADARTSNTDRPRSHQLITQYRYNTLNQVVQQISPDGGLSKFWYDKLGRLAVSQNAQQTLEYKYSYTRYDVLGRITEVGQKAQTTAMKQDISQDPVALDEWITATSGGGGAREQLTITGYDQPYGYPVYSQGIAAHSADGYVNQRNLRNRVSYSLTKDDATGDPVTVTIYTYDLHGNVDTLLQSYTGITAMGATAADRYKLTAYNYDLISGKVNGVDYQPGQPDAFYHRYRYDAENRLLGVSTSRDSIIWEQDAQYQYYLHGPLARTVLGQQQVQGVDYAYTLQGWLKGMNGTSVGNGSKDIGQDGLGDRKTVARDVLGFALHYYDDGTDLDYLSVSGVSMFAAPDNADFRSLYNGNIGGMSVNLAALGRAASGVNAAPLFYKYRYDQLNRLVSMRAYKGFNSSTNAWTPVLLDDYREDVKYDANGNILNYIRNGSPEVPDSAKLMDSLTYKYWANTNQLKQVLDEVGYSGNYTADIDNQTETENYIYDAIGNLVQDKSENLTVAWTVYGKIKSVTKVGGTIYYTYDAAGNRISKSYDGKTTVYVRDASGNVMSIYEKDGVGALVQTESHLYGSSRLGLSGTQTVAPETGISLATGYDPAKLITFTRGEKIFELSNHLGNVLATINDKKLATDDGNGEVAYYEADVVTANDYYPFGMIMPGRKYSSSSLYRYGFNGKENDNEVKGEGGQQDYGMRIYDPRLGRFLSVDPLSRKYPFLTPYQFSSNTPISAIDIDGLESSSNFNYTEDRWFQRFFVRFASNITGINFDNPFGGPDANPDIYTTIADPTLPDRGVVGQQIRFHIEFTMVLAGVMKIEETEYYRAAKDFSERFMNGDPEAVADVSTGLLAAVFTYAGARNQYLQNLKVFSGDGQAFTNEWNKGAREFKMSTGATVKSTIRAAKQVAVEGHEGVDFIDDGLRMKEQPLQVRSMKFTGFTNLDELEDAFKGKWLGAVQDDLLNSGWEMQTHAQGSKTSFKKKIGKNTYYATWEPSNLEHSNDNKPASYWKLSKGKQHGSGKNVRRVGVSDNFKNN